MDKDQKIKKSKTFGNNIRRLRNESGYSQEQVASMLCERGQKVSRSQYSQMECGTYNVTVSVLVCLKELFQTEYEEFFKDIAIDE